jgi:hypothetical protein
LRRSKVFIKVFEESFTYLDFAQAREHPIKENNLCKPKRLALTRGTVIHHGYIFANNK